MKTVILRCPECGHFIAEVSEFGRGVCRDCHCELTYFSARARSKTRTVAEAASAVTVTTWEQLQEATLTKEVAKA
mgnify:CR=1 FL=1